MRKIRVRRWTNTWRCTSEDHMSLDSDNIKALAVIGATYGSGFCMHCLYVLPDFLKRNDKSVDSLFIPSHVPKNVIAPIERFVASITRSK